MTREELVGYFETICMRKPGPPCRAGEMYFGAQMAKLGDDMRGRLVERFPGDCRI